MFDRKIWDSIGNKKTCAYRMGSRKDTLCKNKYNLTGICSEFSCPLANTKYATIRFENEKVLLCVKEPERSTTPVTMWEEIELGYDYKKALETIENKLADFDQIAIDRCKNRLTQCFEALERIIEMSKTPQDQLVARKKRMTRREKVRALKALNTINFEKEVGDELMERLKTGVYGTDLLEQFETANTRAKNYRSKRFVTEAEESDTKTKKKKKGKKKETIEW
ncbi:mitogen_activated protein kinase [Enterospora canceri]|uniref:Mitogen_activated protein kinase n=1 Tax=Enterospora canceri TaxID=1081671 RepID=A0A1Y1SAM5_9MICR|nr:mitogen_activated protein kinase [Enterospora canceri]